MVHKTLLWRHNGHDGVYNHQPHECLLNRPSRRRSKKTWKLRVTGLCAGNSPETGEFPAHMASNAENVSIWWRHHGTPYIIDALNSVKLLIDFNASGNVNVLILTNASFVKFRFHEILKTWSIASLTSICDAELADDRNQVDVKIDPRQACFFQNTRSSILPPCSILPRLTIHKLIYLRSAKSSMYHNGKNSFRWWWFLDIRYLLSKTVLLSA